MKSAKVRVAMVHQHKQQLSSQKKMQFSTLALLRQVFRPLLLLMAPILLLFLATTYFSISVMAIHFGPGNGGSSIGSMQTGTGSKVNEHGDILLGGLFPIHQKGK